MWSLRANTATFVILKIVTLLLIQPLFGATNANSYEIKAFSDFLNFQQLKHGIIVQEAAASRNIEDLHDMMEKFQIRFHNINVRNASDFETNFYFSSPRVGILVEKLESLSIRQQIFEEASTVDYFNNSQAWLIVTHDSPQVWSNVKSTFDRVNININSDVTLALQIANNSLKLYDLYKVCHLCGSPLQIEEKGYWSLDTGFVVPLKFRESFVRRRRNFENITMKAGTYIREKPADWNNMEYLENVGNNKQLDSMQRKTYHLIKMMEPMLNVSFEIVFCDAWGAHVNGNYTGAMGKIIAHEIEFAICPMRFTLDRVHPVQYTPEVHTEVIRFLFRHPRRNVIRNIFFEPFTDTVWWSVLALTVLTILLLVVHVRHENKLRPQQRQRKKPKQHHNQSSLLQRHQLGHQLSVESRFDFIVLIILEAIFMQGPSPDIFTCVSTRTLIISICVFSVMLLQFYSAFIVGSLLADVPRSITTMPALYNSSLAIGMENVSYNYELFVNTTNQIARDIYTHRMCRDSRRHILTLEKGAERIGRGGFAFHVAVDRAYRILKYIITEAEFCELQEIAMNPPFTSALALRKGSIYREYFAQSILHFRATSLLRYNDKLWEVQKTDCSLSQDREVDVDMEHFIPALAFLAMAMLISASVLLLEMTVNWWQCHRRTRNSNATKAVGKREF